MLTAKKMQTVIRAPDQEMHERIVRFSDPQLKIIWAGLERNDTVAYDHCRTKDGGFKMSDWKEAVKAEMRRRGIFFRYLTWVS